MTPSKIEVADALASINTAERTVPRESAIMLIGTVDRLRAENAWLRGEMRAEANKIARERWSWDNQRRALERQAGAWIMIAFFCIFGVALDVIFRG